MRSFLLPLYLPETGIIPTFPDTDAAKRAQQEVARYRQLPSENDSEEELLAYTAQDFIDALRNHNYSLVSSFGAWLKHKHGQKGIDFAGDEVFQFAAYELAQTDVEISDLTALTMLFEHTSGDSQYVVTTMISAVQVLANYREKVREILFGHLTAPGFDNCLTSSQIAKLKDLGGFLVSTPGSRAHDMEYIDVTESPLYKQLIETHEVREATDYVIRAREDFRQELLNSPTFRERCQQELSHYIDEHLETLKALGLDEEFSRGLLFYPLVFGQAARQQTDLPSYAKVRV